MLSNFWLHIFKSVGYRKLANIRKFMQIRKLVLPKIVFKNAFLFFWENEFTTNCKFFNLKFWYKLTQPVHIESSKILILQFYRYCSLQLFRSNVFILLIRNWKDNLLSKRKRVLCWSIYIISWGIKLINSWIRVWEHVGNVSWWADCILYSV